MTHIVVLGSTNTDLVTHVEKAPRHGETVTGRESRTIPGGTGANQAIAYADPLLLQPEIPKPAVVAGAQAARTHGVRTNLAPAPALPSDVPAVVVPLRAAGSLCAARGAGPLAMPYRSEIEARYTS